MEQNLLGKLTLFEIRNMVHIAEFNCKKCPFQMSNGDCMIISMGSPCPGHWEPTFLWYSVEPDVTKKIKKSNCEKKDKDNVNHPEHYTRGGIECIDGLKAATADLHGIEAVCTANAIKYLWRWKNKNGIEDLRKAIWYITRLISEIEGGNDG